MIDSHQLLLKHSELEKIALTCLTATRILMESGARAQVAVKCAEMITHGLGADFMGLRVGYASLAISINSGENTITRMISVGRHGVNHRLDQEVRKLTIRVAKGGMKTSEVNAELDHIKKETNHHPAWFVALAVGLACASFGRLLGMDWAAYPAVFISSSLSQYTRRYLLKNNANVFVVATFIAFLASMITGLLSEYLSSNTINLAMMASILLLVPGVPATNAQTDIMDGFPTMGSARAVSVIMIMVFATTGVWISQALLGIQK